MVEEAASVGNASGDGRWQPRVGDGGRVMLIRLALTYLLLLRGSELFNKRTDYLTNYTAYGGGTRCFSGGCQLAGGTEKEADKVEVRFRCSKGDQGSCLLYTSPSPRDQRGSRMPSSA